MPAVLRTVSCFTLHAITSLIALPIQQSRYLADVNADVTIAISALTVATACQYLSSGSMLPTRHRHSISDALSLSAITRGALRTSATAFQLNRCS